MPVEGYILGNKPYTAKVSLLVLQSPFMKAAFSINKSWFLIAVMLLETLSKMEEEAESSVTIVENLVSKA